MVHGLSLDPMGLQTFEIYRRAIEDRHGSPCGLAMCQFSL
jgi:hypothetical protein